MTLPKAIHRYARRQRIAPIDQPAGEIEPVRLFAPGHDWRQNGRHVRLDRRPVIEKITPQVNERLARLGALAHHQRGGDIIVHLLLLLFQIRDALRQRRALWIDLLIVFFHYVQLLFRPLLGCDGERLLNLARQLEHFAIG